MTSPEIIKPSFLLVCLGNICRSPLAEAAFREAAHNAGINAEIDSAGTGDYHIGQPPDPRAIRVAQQAGIDISHYQARQINMNDFSKYSYILALDSSNLRDIECQAPASSSAHISLLMDPVDGSKGHSVADPYYGHEEDFFQCWQDVTKAAQSWLTKL